MFAFLPERFNGACFEPQPCVARCDGSIVFLPRRPRWPFELIVARFREQRADDPAVLAFLELMEPGFEQAAGELIDAGASTVQVVPLFLAPGKHTRVDLPALMDAARARWPTIDFTVLPTLTESPAVREAIVTSALQAGSTC